MTEATPIAARVSGGARVPAPEPVERTKPVEQVAAFLNVLAEQPESEAEPVEPVAEPESEPEPVEPAAEAEPQKITTLKALAEAAGIEMEALYALQVGMGDGSEPQTLGQLKDAVKAGIDLDGRSAALQDQKAALENEVIRVQSELREAMTMANLSPEALEQAREAYRETLQREQAALFAAVPDLKDPDFRKQAHMDVTELAATYGIKGAEVDNLADHRVYKLAMDYAALRKRVAAANPATKKTGKGTQRGTGSGQVNGSGNSAALGEKAKATGLVHDQVRAVAALLGEIK